MSMLPDNVRKAIMAVLIIWVLLHVFLNLDSADVFFLFFYMKMPLAFLVVISALMGAGAVFLFQFVRKQREEKTGEKKEG